MPLPALLAPLLGIASQIFDRVIPDKAAAEKAKLEMAAALQSQDFQLALEQIKVNAEEAKSPNWFVAGARPFVMWTCGVAFAYATILEPFARFIAQVVFAYKGQFPVIDTMMTMQVLLGLLGLGVLRTREKEKGVESNR
jgi:hypothetical protein